MRNQPPMHKPALVAASLEDDYGNRRRSLFRRNVKARRVLWQFAVKVPANPYVTKLERRCESATHNESRYSAGIVAGQSRLAVPSAFIGSSFNRSCYERDNGYKTHRAKRSCLLQGHYRSDDNLEGTPKRKQEAIWQSTFFIDHLINPRSVKFF
jgi:hypothetical protein